MIGNEPPNILWDRSFPNTASLYPGESVNLTAYVLSTTGVESVTFNGQEMKLKQVDSLIYSFDATITENGTYRTEVVAGNGSKVVNQFDAHWFSDVLVYNAVSQAPEVSRSDFTIVDWNTQQETEEKLFTQYVRYYEITGNNRWKWTQGGTKGEDGYVGMSINGFYLMTVADEKGAWRRVPIQMNQIYVSGPSMWVFYNEKEQAISVELSLQVNPTRITLNDEDLEIPDIHFPTKGSYKMMIPVSKSGTYTVRVYYNEKEYTTRKIDVTVRSPKNNPTKPKDKEQENNNTEEPSPQQPNSGKVVDNAPITRPDRQTGEPNGKPNSGKNGEGTSPSQNAQNGNLSDNAGGSGQRDKERTDSGKINGNPALSPILRAGGFVLGGIVLAGILFWIILLIKRKKDDEEDEENQN